MESPSIRFPLVTEESAQPDLSLSATGANQELEIDNDISDLLQDNFGPPDVRHDENNFIDDFDERNLPLLVEIFEDLKKAVNSESPDKSRKGSKSDNEKTITKDCKTVDPPEKTVLDIQSEIELRNELDRVEKLRKPKFQTLPACDKRAKQEAQWREAVREAKKVSTLLCSSDSGVGCDNLSTNDLIQHLPAKEFSMSSDLSSLDLDLDLCGNDSTSTQCVQTVPVPIVKSTLMVNTKKHLSAANHFPANSRIFNRSLEQLQCQADAISSAYLSAAASKLQRQSHQGIKRLHKTANITKYLKDGNNNLVQHGDKYSPNLGYNSPVDYFCENPLRKGKKPVEMKARGLSKLETHYGANPEFVNYYTGDAMMNKNNNPVNINQVGINPVSHFLPSTDDEATRYLASHGTRTPLPPSLRDHGHDIVTLCPPIIATHQAMPTHQVLHKFSKTIDASKPVFQRNSTGIYTKPNQVNSVIQKIPPMPLQSKVELLNNLSHKSRNLKKVSSNNILTLNLPVITSCFNCQKLSKVLPYMAHNRRKEAMACRKVLKTPMFLLCEMCGGKVRETVIFGDHMNLDHVSSAHLPFFLSNSRSKGMLQEGSQNRIDQGE